MSTVFYKMTINLLQIPLCILYVHVLAFEDVNSEMFSTEMIEDGKNQYQLIQERGKLPQYGDCWKNAVEHIHEGCRYLTEDVQGDIALQITNCFLEMSGHETYHCDRDKKQNVRRICISSMSDRAFNVYTEFYTHAQNICWFLRGQIWQEKIAERTVQVGEQLQSSLAQQTLLLRQQQESLRVQEQLLDYGRSLERVLNESRLQAESVMDEIRTSTVRHQQLLTVLANSLSGLQSWLIGEISWFDSLVFYISGAIVIMIVTSARRTAAARLPLLFVLSTNMILERVLCDRMHYAADQGQIQLVHEKLYKYIWLCRQVCVTIAVLVVAVQVYFYRDYAVFNNRLLLRIHEQNTAIREELERLKQPPRFSDKISIIRESPGSRASVDTEIVNPVISDYYNSSEASKNSVSTGSSLVKSPGDVSCGYSSNRHVHGRCTVSTHREADRPRDNANGWTTVDDNDDSTALSSSFRRYNLRNRAGTPASQTGK